VAKLNEDLQVSGTPRTPADRMAELNERFERRYFSNLHQQMSDGLTGSYDKAPQGPHGDQLMRVVRAFSRLPVRGKEVIVSLGPDGPWRLGLIEPGQPGSLVVLPVRFDTYENGFRAVFRRRWARVMALPGGH
jgi:hypothetical protein